MKKSSNLRVLRTKNRDSVDDHIGNNFQDAYTKKHLGNAVTLDKAYTVLGRTSDYRSFVLSHLRQLYINMAGRPYDASYTKTVGLTM